MDWVMRSGGLGLGLGLGLGFDWCFGLDYFGWGRVWNIWDYG